MMRKPKELTDDEWDALTSPENYFMDGEVSRSQADRIFQQRVKSIVNSRRAAKGSTESDNRPMCVARKNDGQRCGNRAKPGVSFCGVHLRMFRPRRH